MLSKPAPRGPGAGDQPMVNHPNRSKKPTHTAATHGWGAGNNQNMRVNVRLVRTHWVSEEGHKFRAQDGVWTGDQWGRVSLDLATLTSLGEK